MQEVDNSQNEPSKRIEEYLLNEPQDPVGILDEDFELAIARIKSQRKEDIRVELQKGLCWRWSSIY